MSLEAGTYISDLVVTNPTGTDPRRQGDDHVRLIKNVIQNTFPNITGPVTATQSEINLVTDATNFIPSGLIAMWSGSVSAIPAGWSLCDGLGITPDLSGKFIIGSKTDTGATYDVGDTGGSAGINISSTTEPHTLTIAEMPSHVHNNITRSSDGSPANYLDGVDGGGTSGAVNTEATGGGDSHSHGFAYNDTEANIPPYYALAYIIKD